MNLSSISNTHEATIIPAPSAIVPWDDELHVPDISVIIVSWNSKTFLEQCLESLALGVDRPYEVIVVDNNSNDGSPEAVTRKFPWVRLVHSGVNLGFAKANNLGIGHSRGTYIALVNSDVKVLPECLDKLADFLDANPGVGMVGPRIFYGDGRQQSSCRRFPSLWNNACEIFGLNKIFPRSAFFAGEHMFYFGYDRTCEVDVLVGCFIMARSTAVAEFGLLDEEFFMYCEDLDWTRRCGFAGWKVMFYPAAKAVHYCGGSSRNEPRRFAVEQEQSRLRLWHKHHSRTAARMFVILATIGHGIRILFAATKTILNSEEHQRAADAVRTRMTCLRVLWGGAPRDVPKV